HRGFPLCCQIRSRSPLRTPPIPPALAISEPNTPSPDTSRQNRVSSYGQITEGRSLFRDYVGDRVHSELKEWDVVVPHRKERGNAKDIFGLSISFRSREKGDFDDVEVWRATGDANRIADPFDARLLLTKQEIDEAKRESGSGGDRVFCQKRARPLLLVHMIGETGSDKNRRFTGPVVSLSFCLPVSGITPEARSYQVNAVYRRQLELAFEPDDDEEKMQADDRHG
ncbi:MAG: hypothetical protein OXF79_17225, partial [Chloroflexi bacterium]|nr:hypothetical protein [Chloroflexota bacterium]